MKYKYVKINRMLIVSYLAMSLLVFWPMSDIVDAAAPINVTGWESFNVGATSGSNSYCSFKEMWGGGFTVTDSKFYSGAKSIKCYAVNPGTTVLLGYINLTTNYSYIGSWSMTFYAESTGQGQIWDFYDGDYPGSDWVARLYFDDAGGGFANIKWYDAIGQYTTIFTWLENEWVTITCTNNASTNDFVITATNDTGLQNTIYKTSHKIADWTGFTEVVVHATDGGAGYIVAYMDEFIIDTTLSGYEGDPPDSYLGVNCYDEETGGNVTNFTFLAVNTDGESYFDYLLNNTFIVAGVLLPQGQCSITIAATDYYSRTYNVYIDGGYFIIDDVTYNSLTINAYLPSINLSYLYYLQVIDEYLYPVEDARVLIQGSISSNTSFINVSDTRTDGYGYTQVYLGFGKEYSVTITKDGFNNKTELWIPDAAKYGIEYPKVFKINRSFDETETYEFWDYITFTGTMYLNNSIQINYTDSLSSTTNATFYTFERYNFTSTLKNTNTTTDNTHSFWIEDINSSRLHQCTVYLNHSLLGFEIATVTILPINVTRFDTADIETKIKNVFGDFELGYVNTFFIFLPAIIIIILSGPVNVGLGVMGGGLWLGFVANFLIVPTQILIIVPFLVVIGMLLMIVKGGKNKI